MALALFAFFCLFAYTNYGNTTKSIVERNGPIEMTEIKPETKAIFTSSTIPLDKESTPFVKTPTEKTAIKSNKPAKKKSKKPTSVNLSKKLDVKPIPDYLEKGIKWLSDAQYENGGWGAGLASQQNIRNPKSVNIDPATTAFAAMALMNTGSTLSQGVYKKNIKGALILLLDMTEKSSDESNNITDINGTQPQRKLGQNIDLSMTTQFFARAIPQLEKDQKLKQRTKEGLEKCLAKIEKSQHKDGSWNDQGWAPVLQSAMANNALEMSSELKDVKVNEKSLKRSKNYQKTNVTDSGSVATEKAAGIQLYAYSSVQRATAVDAKRVTETLDDVEEFAFLDDAETMPTPEAIEDVAVMLENKGIKREEAKDIAASYAKNKAATKQMNTDAVLNGFGNNGGEEFLSYMMASESMVESSDDAWGDWHQKMTTRLGKVQNGDGSWSGHHCITSPVFCTAAVIMTLTADRK